MEVGNCFRNFPDHSFSCSLVQFAFFGQSSEKLSANKFHHQVDVLPIRESVEQPHDVRVVQLLEDLDFGVELFHHILGFDLSVGDLLQGEDFFVLFVDRPVDFTESSLALATPRGTIFSKF